MPGTSPAHSTLTISSAAHTLAEASGERLTPQPKSGLLQLPPFQAVQLLTLLHTLNFVRRALTVIPPCMELRGNSQEGQGSPNRGNRLQESDIFISLKRQEETNQ